MRKSLNCFMPAACALGLALVLLTPAASRADGCFFGGPDEPWQEAAISYRDGVEEMTLRVSFQGASAEFGWVVPFPSEPRIEEADPALFGFIDSNYSFSYPDVRAGGKHLGDGSMGGEEVQVMQECKVGIFDTVVLRARDPAPLAAWLDEHDYPYGPEHLELFQGYIDKGWCFAAFRVDPSGVDESGLSYGMAAAFLQPLRFTFESSQPVFPLRISAGNSKGSVVKLHLIGESTYRCDLIKERDTDAVSQWELEKLVGFMPELQRITDVDGDTYLTTFIQDFSRPQMSSDLVFLPDPIPTAMPEGVPFITNMTAGSVSGGELRRPNRTTVLLALAILILALAAIPILFRNHKQSNGWRFFTGLCATFVTMAIVATLAMAMLYQEGQNRVRSPGWEDFQFQQGMGLTNLGYFQESPEGDMQANLAIGLITPHGFLLQDGMSIGYDCWLREISPDGRHLAVNQGEYLEVWDLDPDGLIAERHQTGDSIYRGGVGKPAWNQRGDCLVYLSRRVPGSDDEVIKIFDTESGDSREVEGEAPGPLLSGWSRDGKTLTSIRVANAGTDDLSAAVDIIDTESGRLQNTVLIPMKNRVASCPIASISDEGRTVTCSSIPIPYESGFELELFNSQTGVLQASREIPQALSTIMFKALGEHQVLLICLEAQAASWNGVLKKYVIDTRDLSILDEAEISLVWMLREPYGELAYYHQSDRESRITLDEQGRYLLVDSAVDRTVLVDLQAGKVFAVPFGRAGWVVAR